MRIRLGELHLDAKDFSGSLSSRQAIVIIEKGVFLNARLVTGESGRI